MLYHKSEHVSFIVEARAYPDGEFEVIVQDRSDGHAFLWLRENDVRALSKSLLDVLKLTAPDDA